MNPVPGSVSLVSVLRPTPRSHQGLFSDLWLSSLSDFSSRETCSILLSRRERGCVLEAEVGWDLPGDWQVYKRSPNAKLREDAHGTWNDLFPLCEGPRLESVWLWGRSGLGLTAKRKGLIEKIDVPIGRAGYPFHSKRSVRWSRLDSTKSPGW